ncbi:MAG: N-acetyltransferase [Deltaproteobacteria bacterium]|nr:MAG: N-acetyltransferase [Deltaproteobacteria bacterium]
MSGNPAPSERLSYRPWDAETDADAAFAIYGNEEVTRHIGGYTPSTVEEAATMLTKWGRATAAYAPRYNVWAAVHEGQVIGAALLKPLPIVVKGQRTITDDIEIGWHLGRDWWGQGFATEMGRAMMRHGFEDLGLTELNCVIEMENERSVAVARRLGLKPQGSTAQWYAKTLLHFKTWPQ